MLKFNPVDYLCRVTVNTKGEPNKSLLLVLSLSENIEERTHERYIWTDMLVDTNVSETLINDSEGGQEGLAAGIFSCVRTVFHCANKRMTGVRIWDYQSNMSYSSKAFEFALQVTLQVFLGYSIFSVEDADRIKEFDIHGLQIEKIDKSIYDESRLISIRKSRS